MEQLACSCRLLPPLIRMITVRWQALFSELKEAWPAWLFLGGIALALIVAGIFSSALTDTIRYAGTSLQLFGLLLVALGLSKMRRLFGRPPVITKVSQWFKRFLAAFKRPKAVTIEGATAAGSAQAFGVGRVTVGVRPDAALEERVSVLEQNLQGLQEEIDTRFQQLREELSVARQGIQRETRERLAEDQKAMAKIEEVAVGGLHLEFVGLLWLILGTIGTSVPDEIAACLSNAY